MLHHIKKLFGIKPKEATADQPLKTYESFKAPYKVDAPTEVAEQATQAVVESIAKPAKAKKAPAAKKVPAVKKPRAPKKPKAV